MIVTVGVRAYVCVCACNRVNISVSVCICVIIYVMHKCAKQKRLINLLMDYGLE